MAYPAEAENVEYLKYLEEYSLGEHEGPKMTKDEWRMQRKPKKNMDSLLEGHDQRPPRVQY